MTTLSRSGGTQLRISRHLFAFSNSTSNSSARWSSCIFIGLFSSKMAFSSPPSRSSSECILFAGIFDDPPNIEWLDANAFPANSEVDTPPGAPWSAAVSPKMRSTDSKTSCFRGWGPPPVWLFSSQYIHKLVFADTSWTFQTSSLSNGLVGPQEVACRIGHWVGQWSVVKF